MTTATASKADIKRQELLKKKAKVEKLMKQYVDLTAKDLAMRDNFNNRLIPYQEEYERKTQKIFDEHNRTLAPVVVERTEIKCQLLEIAGEKDKKGNLVNKQLFEDGNWNFEDADGHYLHIETKSVPEFGPNFSLSKFIAKFGEYCNVTFKIAQLKKVFTDGDQRGKFTKMEFDLKNTEEVVIKQKVEKA